MQFEKQRKLMLLLLSSATLIGTQQASAFPSGATEITTYCSNNGYDLSHSSIIFIIPKLELLDV
jgi:hypothetical protein